MRPWARCALLVLGCLPAPEAAAQRAATKEPATLRVRLAEQPRGGAVRLLLYDDPVSFGRFGQPARTARFAPGAGDGYVLTGIPPGEYALVAHHDVNGNSELEKSFVGIPTEPIAISRGYRPKGPPVFARARFALAAGEETTLELELFEALGPRGLLSVGVGVIGRSSPYAGDDGGVLQPIPAVTYNGARLEWFGPNLRYGLAGSDRLRLAATASYRLRAYEEDDSPVLAGLGDREDTLMAGLAAVAELPAGFGLSVGYEHDVLDRIGGGTVRIEADRSFQRGAARLSPSVALRWSSSELADHDFGVPPALATPQRPAYSVGDAWTVEAGLGAFVELGDRWRLVLDVGVDLLPGEVTASPIVDDETVLRGFLALTYVL